jgi:hypothetical protein
MRESRKSAHPLIQVATTRKSNNLHVGSINSCPGSSTNDSFAALAISDSKQENPVELIAYSQANAIATVEELLASMPSVMSGRASVDFHMDVGQQLYAGKYADRSTDVELPIRNGLITRRQVLGSGIKPYFYNYLLASAKHILMENLRQQGYQPLDTNAQGGYTDISFSVEPGPEYHSITIADEEDFDSEDSDEEDVEDEEIIEE